MAEPITFLAVIITVCSTIAAVQISNSIDKHQADKAKGYPSRAGLSGHQLDGAYNSPPLGRRQPSSSTGSGRSKRE